MKNHKTNFGFTEVDPQEKHGLVHDVFSGVAPVYDVMNDLMSLGVHRLWKDSFVNLVRQDSHRNILDVGGGTGDIAFRLKKHIDRAHIYILDINKDMVLKGLERSFNNGYVKNISWVVGDAEQLPFQDESFCAYTTAFCFRNLTNISQALNESYRVLKKGGKFYCLEFSKVDNSILGKLYKLWSFKVIPKIGALVAKNKNAYQYLVESIDKFYNANDYKKLIENAGFKNVNHHSYSFGIASIYVGTKI